MQRIVTGPEGFQPWPTGVALAVGDAEEHWAQLDFPLLFCDLCHRSFLKDWSRARFRYGAKSIFVIGMIMIAVMVLLLFALIMPIVSVPGILLVLYMANRFRTRKQIDPFILSHLNKIMYVRELIRDEDEYQLYVYDAQAYRGSK